MKEYAKIFLEVFAMVFVPTCNFFQVVCKILTLQVLFLYSKCFIFFQLLSISGRSCFKIKALADASVKSASFLVHP